jgi:hypothetical protein
LSNKKPPLRYFYLNGDLHKKLKITRHDDIIKAFNYRKGMVETYLYSHVKRYKEPAFTSVQVAKMLNRKRQTVLLLIMWGDFPPPQKAYPIGDPSYPRSPYYWSEQDIMDLHDYFSTRHSGHPRNDGGITPKPMPSKRELRAMIHDEEIFYVRVGDEYVPTWKAPDI